MTLTAKQHTGGPLFRSYLRWAEPRYARMKPEWAAWAREFDVWLYTTASGRGVFLGALAMIVLTTWWLSRSAIPWWGAFAFGVCIWFGFLCALALSWVEPGLFRGRLFFRSVVLISMLGCSGGLLGFVVGSEIELREGNWRGSVDQQVDRLLGKFSEVLPLILGVIVGTMMIQWGVARWRGYLQGQRLERVRLEHERDLATLRSREAEMRVLQAQIQPHFIFNSLSAVQHWVDTNDARASTLLRALTSFLRCGTELMGRERVRVEEEFAMVSQYLAVMAQRLGARLDWHLEPSATLRDVMIPPGVVMTLVENAIEHAVEPSLRSVVLRVTAEVTTTDQARRWAEIWVRDDGAGWPPDTPPADGTGLANVRSRLAIALGPSASLALQLGEGGGCEACIRWPL